jgi:hypothetical protein
MICINSRFGITLFRLFRQLIASIHIQIIKISLFNSVAPYRTFNDACHGIQSPLQASCPQLVKDSIGQHLKICAGILSKAAPENSYYTIDHGQFNKLFQENYVDMNVSLYTVGYFFRRSLIFK